MTDTRTPDQIKAKLELLNDRIALERKKLESLYDERQYEREQLIAVESAAVRAELAALLEKGDK